MTMVKTTLAKILQEHKMEILNNLLVDYYGVVTINPLNNPIIKGLSDLNTLYADLLGGMTSSLHKTYIMFLIKFLGIDFNGYNGSDELEVGLYNPEGLSIYKDIKIMCLSQKYYRSDIFENISFNLNRYIGYLKKFITDNGFARKVIEKRTLKEDSTSDGTSRSYNSDTPQVSGVSDETLDTLEFLSNATKDVDSASSNREGEYTREIDTISFKEQKENFAILYEEAILDYIFSIPMIVYDFYSMRHLPLSFTKERMLDYYKELKELD